MSGLEIAGVVGLAALIIFIIRGARRGSKGPQATSGQPETYTLSDTRADSSSGDEGAGD